VKPVHGIGGTGGSKAISRPRGGRKGGSVGAAPSAVPSPAVSVSGRARRTARAARQAGGAGHHHEEGVVSAFGSESGPGLHTHQDAASLAVEAAAMHAASYDDMGAAHMDGRGSGSAASMHIYQGLPPETPASLRGTRRGASVTSATLRSAAQRAAVQMMLGQGTDQA